MQYKLFLHLAVFLCFAYNISIRAETVVPADGEIFVVIGGIRCVTQQPTKKLL